MLPGVPGAQAAGGWGAEALQDGDRLEVDQPLHQEVQDADGEPDSAGADRQAGGLHGELRHFGCVREYYMNFFDIFIFLDLLSLHLRKISTSKNSCKIIHQNLEVPTLNLREI